MKLKVIKTYSDKNTGETMEQGRIVEYEPVRAKELIAAKVAEEVRETPPKPEISEKRK